MSASPEVHAGKNPAGQALLGLPWGLWRRQTGAILRFELKKAFLSRRALGLIFLASLPVLLTLLMSLTPDDVTRKLGGIEVNYAIIFRTFMLRFVVFFGCVAIFTGLFRGDILEKTLHYYFLTPVRREVLVFGKYTAGVTAAFLIFAASTAASYLILHIAGGGRAGREFMVSGAGLGHLSAYLAVIFLACVGYGSMFLLAGLFFRNPIVPAAFLLGWESINLFLPPVLKQISVIFYLESLCPVAIPTGPVTILADPAPAWLSVPGLAVLTFLVLALASWKLKRLEISYSTD